MHKQLGRFATTLLGTCTLKCANTILITCDSRNICKWDVKIQADGIQAVDKQQLYLSQSTRAFESCCEHPVSIQSTNQRALTTASERLHEPEAFLWAHLAGIAAGSDSTQRRIFTEKALRGAREGDWLHGHYFMNCYSVGTPVHSKSHIEFCGMSRLQSTRCTPPAHINWLFIGIRNKTVWKRNCGNFPV